MCILNQSQNTTPMFSTYASSMHPFSTFGHSGLNDLFPQIITRLGESFGSSIPESARDNAQMQSIYNFFSSSLVKNEYMLLAERDRLKAYFATASPMTVIGIQDTTDLDYTTNRVSSKLGSLNYANRKGYYAHNHLLSDVQGVSLGLFNQKLWNRDPAYFGHNRGLWPLQDKESYRWLADFEQFQSFFAQFPQHTAIEVCDREADFYEMFAARKIENVHVVIRSKKDKLLANDEKLWHTLDQQKVSDFYLANIYDDRGKKHEVAFQVKFAWLKIKANYRASRDQPQNSDPVGLYGIVVEQVSALQSWQKKPIVWRLLTTLEISNFEQARFVIQIYIQRWRIEEFHYVLKQGSKIENKQFKQVQALENAITLYSLLSWKVMNLRYGATQFPEASIEEFGFSQKQFFILLTFLTKNKRLVFKANKENPTIKEFSQLLKMLATSSKSKNPPGVKALWIGLSKLNLLIQAFEAFT